ncbi:rcc01693 family protein [uncultured Shimia sp.]|uniref:rcc01693 family protein n=1 Tax=uncultured Shimia sp. TaxID=573152 RepID=UPI0026098B5D|nr:rcc01693 family protein [uncultured Shimia sp.]
MTAFDWPVLLAAGVQRLGLRPQEFWHLTPAELALMLGQGGEETSLARAGLEQLMDAYPDTEGAAGNGRD